MHVCVRCSSCLDPQKCTWRGQASYVAASRSLSIQFRGRHDAKQRKVYGTFTPEELQKWSESKAPTGVGRLGAFKDLEGQVPDAPTSQGRLKRERKAARIDKAQPSMSEWPCAAIDQLIKDAGIEQLTEANAATVNRLDMVLLNSKFWSADGVDHCVYVFSSVECLCTWQKLSNQDYVKLCADGTFKQVFGKWCVIPLGVLSKHQAKTTSSGKPVRA